MVMGFCVAGPFIWNLMERAPERVVAAVSAQPIGFTPEVPDLLYEGNGESRAALRALGYQWYRGVTPPQ